MDGRDSYRPGDSLHFLGGAPLWFCVGTRFLDAGVTVDSASQSLAAQFNTYSMRVPLRLTC